MDMKNVFPHSLLRSKSTRVLPVRADPTLQPAPQPSATLQAPKATPPIAIPRRKAFPSSPFSPAPPPLSPDLVVSFDFSFSPARHRPSPELVFNFDFSFSPCAYADEYAPLLQQRGRTVLALAHQCHQQQKALLGAGLRSSEPEAPHCPRPPHHGLLARALRARGEGVDAEMGMEMDMDADGGQSELSVREKEIVESQAMASACASPVSSECSSLVFAPARGAGRNASRPRAEDGLDEETDMPLPGLTSAFRRALASPASSAQSTPPASPPPTASATSTPSPRSMLPRRCSGTHLVRTAAAEPVVCLSVAEAEPPSPARSPFHGCRARRPSSPGCGPTVVTLGRGRGLRSLLVLSSEELERSLEKGGAAPAPGREREREMDEKEMVRGWEREYERGRPRGRARARGIAVVRAPPAHM